MSEQQYIDFYRAERDTIFARSDERLNALRDGACALLERKGFPTMKEERYRYTDVVKDFAPDYGISLTPAEDAAPCPEEYGTLADASDPVVALNTMLAMSCRVVRIARGERPEHPVQITNMLRGEHPEMVCRRLIIIVEEGAEADVIITDRAVSKQPFLTNQVIEVFVADGARLNLYEIEETHLLCTRYSSLFMQLGRGCSVHHTSLTLFNGHSRNRVDVALCGEYSEVVMNGCVIADKMQHTDSNTLIDHRVPHCDSRQLYKYVLDDSAVGAFAGRILVREGAQKTSSQETNANLCATKTARMFTQPMLEIYADDVKCSHGSTVGQMNEDALFYMRQRGISEAEAKLLLKSAFITEVVECIPLASLRDRLLVLVDRRLKGELSKCEGCKLCE